MSARRHSVASPVSPEGASFSANAGRNRRQTVVWDSPPEFNEEKPKKSLFSKVFSSQKGRRLSAIWALKKAGGRKTPRRARALTSLKTTFAAKSGAKHTCSP